MVLYFTGTGNSLYVAKQLDEVRVSIPQAIHNRNTEFVADTIGIVCPIYGHEMPELVKSFLKNAKFHTNYFYLVLTYGMLHGGAAELAEQYLEECGLKADYINTIIMVDNYLMAFDMKEQLALEPKKKIDEHIAKIKADIEARCHWRQKATLRDKMIHQGYLKMRKAHPIECEGGIFNVQSDCIGCGICTRVCPTGRILLVNQHAEYHDMSKCQMCLACVHHCPQNAIRLKIAEKNPMARYHNENIRLSEIVEANNQTR